MSIKISLKFVPAYPINTIPALVQIMAWRRSGDKPLSEPMMVNLLSHICVTRPQWVKSWFLFVCLQKTLPKLPVPELRSTCEKYLLCVKPIVSAEEFARTEQIVAKFQEPGGQGEFLQKHLQDFAEKVDNWVR